MYCMDEFLYTLILLFSRKRKDTNNLTFSHNTQKPHKHHQNQGFEIRTGPYDPTEKTSNYSALRFVYGLFRVKNHSMPKKQRPARTTVWPSGFVNHDRFLRFERFLFILAFPVNFGQYTGMKLWSDLEKMKEHEEE